jgi:GntR family transcriptional regulator/MocR family aminotransferase
MARRALELSLVADRDDPGALTSQIAGQLRDALADGRLATGERLPSTRMLAGLLGVSRTVVTGAYAQLFAEGWVEGRHGSGTYVADGAPGHPGGNGSTEPGARWEPVGVPADRALVPVAAPLIDLRPGIAWTEGIDRAAWRRAWRIAGASMAGGLPDPQGSPGLRASLTGYLRRSRGVHCSPGQLVVTRGVAGSLGLIAAALLRPGDRVGVEEPGYPAARAVFAAHGLRPVPCPVDSGGLRVDALPGGLRLVYVTPAHQYPLGARLSVPRRRALTSWARATGALIVEDDYDGEFRYDVAPLPALFGLDPEVVVYLGTTTKILTPAMRVGWLAASPGLATRLAAAGSTLGEYASGPAQGALLSLITTGDLERHIRRMRHDYARRRAAMTAVFGGGAAGRLLGDEAGMHMVLETNEPAAMVAAAAAERGVAVATLDRYFGGPVTKNGLVLGYGGARLPDVARGCQILAGVLGHANPGSCDNQANPGTTVRR